MDSFYCNSIKTCDIEEPRLFTGTSYIGGNYYHDSDIINYIGLDNYIILSRKFPNFFVEFNETKTCNDILIPGYINLILDGSPNKIKSDIIKTIHYKQKISSNSNLIIKFKEVDSRITKDTTSIWIFICIVMIFLFVFSIYILVETKNKNIIKFNTN